MPYRTVDHTADLAIEVVADSVSDLLAESVVALTDCLTRVDRVRPADSRTVTLSAPELDRLLVDLLNELIFLYETQALVVCEASLTVAESDSGWSLTGSLRGEEFDLERHGLKTLIKAVTYHQLKIEPTPSGWFARVVFDL